MTDHPQGRMMLLACALLLACSSALAQASAPATATPPRLLTLEEAVRTARERQPSLVQARASATAAAARERQALSGRPPQGSGTASHSRSTVNSAPPPRP